MDAVNLPGAHQEGASPQKPNPTGSVRRPRESRIIVGCAGWSIPRDEKRNFPENGTHLERYAARLPAVEINSSFYRPHRPATYSRWAAAVPAGFRFSVKVPKTITHDARLENTKERLSLFLEQVAGLQTKLGCLLVQLPPSLAFEADVAGHFFGELRDATSVPIALEPRHPTWFAAQVDTLLQSYRIGRVAADPPPVPRAAMPGGSTDFVYHRLHGSPRTYYSTYPTAAIRKLAARLRRESSEGKPVWCVFDNTALGAAMPNALELLRELGRAG